MKLRESRMQEIIQGKHKKREIHVNILLTYKDMLGNNQTYYKGTFALKCKT